MADSNSVKGSFTPPDNVFSYGPGREVVMERRDSGLYQVATIEGKKVAHRFDIAIGSGRKAQTYLFWSGDSVRQLPVSYFVYTNSWANSPSFPNNLVWFNRMIPIRCFECHSSYIQKKPSIRIDAFHELDQFDRTKVVYGIDCERCHGPGAEHAAYQEAYPADKQARYIRSYASLNRLQRMDLCGGCHSGSHEMSKSAFRFKPGDTLSNFYYAESHVAQKPSAMDVHGNQYQLLIGSKCYLQTTTLVCTSCHAPHAMERDNLAAFSQRCMNCHREDGGGGSGGDRADGGGNGVAGAHGAEAGAHGAGTAPFCKMAAQLGAAVLARNCIDCHMPARASRVITLQTTEQKDPMADFVRSHYITIYPDETKKFIAAMKH